MATQKLNDDMIKAILGKGPKQDDIAVSFDDINNFGNVESMKEMAIDIAKYNQMLKERIVFVNDALTSCIPFTRENLYLICAYTGHGKSTVAANISYPLWKQGKKLLVISNEESKQDVCLRIAFLDMGLNFNKYKKGDMPKDLLQKAFILSHEIAKYVKVIDVGFKGGLTTKLEGVKNALEAVKMSDYSCALIDYYQLIQYSVADKSRSRYDVLNDLRIWLGQYIKTSNVPIVMFAQLHSIGKRNNKDLDSRIKECPNIQEPATVVLEVVPHRDDGVSEFIIHKDRFGLAGHRIVCGFDKGRFISLADKVEVEKWIADFKRKNKEKELDELQAVLAASSEVKLDEEEVEDEHQQEVPDMQPGQEK